VFYIQQEPHGKTLYSIKVAHFTAKTTSKQEIYSFFAGKM